MGSYSTLYLDHIELDSYKNFSGDAGWLFLPEDKTKIEYVYYAGKNYDKKIIEKRPAYVTNLEKVKLKLLLSGYFCKPTHFYNRDLWENELPRRDCSRIINLFKTVTLSQAVENPEYNPFGLFKPKYIYSLPELDDLLVKYELDPILELGAGSFLAIVSQNLTNKNAKLIWRYYDIVEGGYETENQISSSINQSKRQFLLITEGSSDTFILQKAIQLLYPDLFPFFSFIDMSENYPFTGTGNIYRFCQGLLKIGFDNSVVIILDNDTEGMQTLRKLQKLKLPENFILFPLPNFSYFNRFMTTGPVGKAISNINRKAVSIECFLDLSYKSNNKPTIRWTSYNKEAVSYQGELEFKEQYTRAFKSVNKSSSNYDFTKIKVLLEKLFIACGKIPNAFG